MRKRFVKVIPGGALALIAAICIMCIPASAGAADVAEVTAGGTTTNYDDFADAWAAAETAGTATVKLLANVDKDNYTEWPITVASGNAITLDLNRNDIDRGLTTKTDNGNVMTVNGSLTLKGAGVVTGGKNNVDTGGVYVGSGGVFIMEGGEISENKSDNGGGVFVHEGEFTMQGGKIHKNTKNNSAAISNGGGVYMVNGTFTMHGGTISENTADNGGGVRVVESKAQNASFTMDGGEITGNTAGQGGGGVQVDRSIFNMSGGEIFGNIAGTQGGGVYVFESNSTLNMSGGRIYGNTADFGGGVSMSVSTSVLNISGGEITGNTATSNGGGVYSIKTGVSTGEINLSGKPVISGNTVNSAANNLYLPDNQYVDIKETLKPGALVGVTAEPTPSGGSSVVVSDSGIHTVASWTSFYSDNPGFGIYLDSNKVVLKIKDANVAAIVMQSGENDASYDNFAAAWYDATTRSSASTNPVTVMLYKDVTSSDNTPEGWPIEVPAGKHIILNTSSYTIDRELTSREYYGNVITVNGSLTLTGAGKVTGGKNLSHGGGVRVNIGGVFTMEGGKISGNQTIGSGGGVLVEGSDDSGGTFNINGGEIIDNTASDGGGVFLTGYSTLNMSGGRISGNTVSQSGGGVFMGGGDVLNMSGGEISGNTADQSGGGVYCETFGAVLSMSGTPVISGNTANNAAYNLYLPDGNTVTIGTGGLSAGANIGVTTQTPPTSSAAVPITGASSADYRRYFTSDGGFAVVNTVTSSGQVVQLSVASLAITYEDEGGEAYTGKDDPNRPTTHTVGTATTLVDGNKDGYTFGGWFTTSDCQTGTDVATLGAYDYTTNITLYAKWKAITHTITVSADPTAGGMVSGGGTFDENSNCTVTATANSGYHFVRWTEGGTEVSTSASYTFNLTADRTLVAVFEQIPVPPINITPAATITQGSAPSNLTINIGGAGNPSNDPAHFGSLEISANGSGYTTVSSGNYTLSFSSIHIALNQSWLNTLTPGVYTLRANLAGAYAGISLTTQLTVTAPPPVPPKTGDNNQPLIWLSLLLVCGAGLLALTMRTRKRRG